MLTREWAKIREKFASRQEKVLSKHKKNLTATMLKEEISSAESRKMVAEV